MIVLTGASGGIGSLILEDRSKIDQVIAIGNSRLPETKKLSNVASYQIDLSSEKEIDSFLKKVESKMSRITLIHAAAVSIDKLAADLTSSEWNTVLDINLKSSFLMSKKLLRKMISEKWGRIIHISSIVGNNGTNGTIAYSTSKTGLVGMSRVLSKEYGRFGITSNILIPGYLNTGLISSLSKEAKSKILKKIPSNKFGDPVNIVNAVEFLIKSDYVNGASINIDGGY